ncbi:hypothetical protein ACJMK2_023566 [Sinanodonta woodiana]|uniref:Uncharacterized protein n=1 Tax=Sinanodonta woodiana TaxID=1069815 RepID=A0ABD3T4M4_SINWO
MEEESMSLKSKSPSINHEAEELREELEKLNRKYEQLEEAFETEKEEATKLNNNIDELNKKLSAEKMVNEQLRFENNQLKHGMEQDKESSKKMFGDMFFFVCGLHINLDRKPTDDLERQKAEFDRVMQEQIRKAKEESLSAAQREAQTMKETERDKYRLLMDQKKLLEEQLVKEKAKNNAKSKEDMDADKFRKVEERMKDEIQRLKREVERVNKTWEKKFAILQQSLHALKDESYLRQTLQRQSAALHHAAVSYSVDTPAGIIPSSKSSPLKRPLPEITKFKAGNPGSGAAGPDFLSYTVSAPSGRGTAMFSVEENPLQDAVMKDDQIPVAKWLLFHM